jgi:hypothetical protein
MKKLLVVLSILLSGLVVAPAAGAVSVIDCSKVSDADCSIAKSDDLNYQSGGKRIWQLVSMALGILGGIAVIMIVIGGIRYTLSNGDAGQTKSAKNTIMYSVIGLVVAMFASGIVLLVQSYFVK